MKRENAFKLGSLFLAGLTIGLLSLNLYLLPSTESLPTNRQNNKVAEKVRSSVADAPRHSPEPVMAYASLDKSDAELANDALIAGDRSSVAGNCYMALKHYDNFQARAKRSGVNLRLRKAACYEGLGQLRIAANYYQTVISESPQNNHLGLAIAGLARVYVDEKRANEAIELLASHGNNIQNWNGLSTGVRSQLRLQWARALEAKALLADSLRQETVDERGDFTSNTNDDLSYPASLAVAHVSESPEAFLAIVDQATLRQSQPSLKLDESRLLIKVLQRPTDSAESIAVSVDSSLQPLILLLEDIEAKLGLTIELSESAKTVVSMRSGEFNFNSITLGALLDQLLVAHGLVWQQRNSVIFVLNEAEAKQQGGLHQFELSSAARAFRRFELEFPEDRFRSVALMSRARLAAMEGHLGAAINLYRELEQMGTKGETQAQLFFNQAKLSLMTLKRADAQSLLYKAVDQTLDRNLQSSSYALLSSLHLTDGELEQAIKTGRRALGTAVTDRQKRIAAIAQARAYLLSQNPFSANEILFRSSRAVESDGKRVAVASMLGAYAHSQGLNKTNKHNALAAKIRLVTSLSTFTADTSNSFVDYYIAGHAYAKYGWRKRAIQMMLIALSKPDLGQWQRQLTFELATMLKNDGQTQQAASLFEQLNEGKDVWQKRASYQVALQNFEAGQTKRCIELGWELLKNEVDKQLEAETLHLLGRAFQRLGEHHSAALCFSGMLPTN